MRLGDTPVPIPNTTVKTKTAENTILETIWEDRWMPDLQAEVPKWLKGLPWKGSRSLVAARGFKSLLLRSMKRKIKKFLTSRKNSDIL